MAFKHKNAHAGAEAHPATAQRSLAAAQAPAPTLLSLRHWDNLGGGDLKVSDA